MQSHRGPFFLRRRRGSPHLWQFDSFDDELGAGMDAMIGGTDTVLGRVGYQEWPGYWPTASDDDFGDFINPVERFVASRTLTGNLEWENSRRIEGDLVDFVTGLKATDGKDISVCGSISVARLTLQDSTITSKGNAILVYGAHG